MKKITLTKRELLISGAAMLLISMFIVSVPVKSQPGLFEPFTPGPHDWITWYGYRFEASFWSAYEGDTIVYQFGVSIGDSAILPFSEFEFFPGAPNTAPELLIDANEPIYYDALFVPFLVVVFAEKGDPETQRVTAINPNQRSSLGFGFLDLDHKGTPKDKYADVNVHFQYKRLGEEWPEEWLTLNKNPSVNCHVVFTSITLYGTYTADVDYDSIPDLSGYFFGGDFKKPIAIKGM